MKRPPLVLDESKILSEQILKTNNEAIFDLRLKSALLKKVSAELTKLMEKMKVLFKNVLYKNKN